MSYYKQINNVKYDRDMLAMAERLQAGERDGRISADDAKVLARKVNDGPGRTPTEARTVRKIYREANFTQGGRETFERANRKAGGVRSHENRKAPAQPTVQSRTAAQASQLGVRLSQTAQASQAE